MKKIKRELLIVIEGNGVDVTVYENEHKDKITKDEIIDIIENLSGWSYDYALEEKGWNWFIVTDKEINKM